MFPGLRASFRENPGKMPLPFILPGLRIGKGTFFLLWAESVLQLGARCCCAGGGAMHMKAGGSVIAVCLPVSPLHISLLHFACSCQSDAIFHIAAFQLCVNDPCKKPYSDNFLYVFLWEGPGLVLLLPFSLQPHPADRDGDCSSSDHLPQPVLLPCSLQCP